MISITDECIAEVQFLINSKKPLETGGILIGTRKKNMYSILHIVDSGPNCIETRNRFKKDFVYAQSELLRLNIESKGRWGYLGEWHSHPDGRLFPSPVDRKSMGIVTRSLSFSGLIPILLIADVKNKGLVYNFYLSDGHDLQVYK